MDEVVRLSQQNRRDLFEDLASTKRTTPAVFEKDFWVTWILSKLILDSWLSKNLVFKGVTSLSKVYNLVERFSEDIDLVLDWNLLTGENPELPSTNTQQQKFFHRLVADADVYIKSELLDTLRKLTGDICDLTPSDELCIINVNYSSIFNDEYLSSGIKLEIGPLASMMPSTQRTIFSYVAETHPTQFQHGSCSVSVINAERTFWQKVLILYQEYYRPQDKPQPKGYS